MNATKIALATLALSTSLTAFAASDVAVLTVTGAINAGTCQLSEATQSVQLDQLTKSAFEQGDNLAHAKNLVINLEGCATDTVAALFEKNGSDITSAGTLANAAGGAAGVEIALYDQANNRLDLNKREDYAFGTEGATSLTYKVGYYVPDTAALEAGSVNATVQYRLAYK